MKTISYDEFQKRLEDTDVINVLPEETFREKHIPATQNIPKDKEDFASRVESAIGGKDEEVILYCAQYECPASKQAAETLEKAGFTDVYVYEGGTKEWFERQETSSQRAKAS